MPITELLPHCLRIAVQLAYERLCKLVFVIKSMWWGVEVGKGISVCGIPKVRKTPGSKISIGANCRLLSDFASNLHGLNRKSMLSTLSTEANLIIGHDCGLSGVVIACANSVILGDRVMVGANCTISDTDSHPVDYQDRHPEFYNEKLNNWEETVKTAPVSIEDDVFIGMNTIILKGVTIGKGAVVGAGSVVSKSIPQHVIAAGNPARVIRHLNLVAQ